MKVEVSIIMPVYNAARFLNEAMQSMLQQSFTQFEFIIVNDCSTDASEDIILSFKDDRIVYLKNERNEGVTAALNKSIALCKGEFVARMDADDISLKDRLQKQVAFLKSRPNVAMVATTAQMIDGNGDALGVWQNDLIAVSDEDITALLAKTNCIVHPSVMIRKEVLQKFMYRSEKNAAEDYDLWLRMKSHGYGIAKLEEPLLLYRVHQASVTANKKLLVNTNLRVLKQKWTFIKYALSHLRINAFFIRVLYSSARSAAAYLRDVVPNALRWCKRFISISPIMASQQFSLLSATLKTAKADIVYFFPYTHMGGAERVHADVVQACGDNKSLVFFTGFSRNENFIRRFQSENSVVLNVPHCINSVWYGARAKQLIADFINAQNTVVTFGSNADFYFRLLPLLHAHVMCADLIHAFKFQPGANKAHLALLPYAPRLNHRVFISQTAKRDFEVFLKSNLYGPEVSERLMYIPNATIVPASLPHKRERMKIIFVGRESPEKRFHLFEQIVQRVAEKHATVAFEAAGLAQSNNASLIRCNAELNDEDLDKLYSSAHILVLTSSREGFPMVIMEAMAHGVVPVATAVGDIAMHVNEANGFVCTAEDEAQIVDEMCVAIEALITDREKFERTSQNAFHYAKSNFSKDQFAAAYKKLLLRK